MIYSSLLKNMTKSEVLYHISDHLLNINTNIAYYWLSTDDMELNYVPKLPHCVLFVTIALVKCISSNWRKYRSLRVNKYIINCPFTPRSVN